jgi:anaerobic selenocysteine-containing dehydrogenase
MVAVELARRLGGDLSFTSTREIWTEIEHVAVSHRGITGEVLRSATWRDGVPAPLPEAPVTIGASRPPGEESGFERVEGEGRPTSMAGETETAEVAAVENSPTHASTVVAGHEETEPEVEGSPSDNPADAGVPSPPTMSWPPADLAEHPAPTADSYSLRLVAGRELYDAGSLVAHSPSLAPLARGTSVALGTYDAERLGVSTGDRVRITSARGSFETGVTIHAGVPRGAAVMAFNQPGQGAADLIDASTPVTDVRVETL